MQKKGNSGQMWANLPFRNNRIETKKMTPSTSPSFPRVKLLDPLVAERIAAGEVIERPASIVKECVENALDAGAEHILVSLEDGGKKLIQITDDGHGMSEEDLKICTLRHATSKIHQLSDLEHLQTLGFRGEALPSIQAVSDLKIISRPQKNAETSSNDLSNSAYVFQSHLGHHNPVIRKETFGHFIDSPHGTQLTSAGLFSQIPARLKFLKSTPSEVSAVKEWMERLSLAFPHVSFQLKSDGKTIFKVDAESESERVRKILSPHSQFEVKTYRFSPLPSIQLRLHWIHGESLPNTKRLTQVINHRPIRDKLIQQASLSGFKQSLLPGQYPALALYLELPPELLDVNVHPTKTEVRFLNSGQVFHWVDTAVKEMIQKEGAIRSIPASNSFFSESSTSIPESLTKPDSISVSPTFDSTPSSFSLESLSAFKKDSNLHGFSYQSFKKPIEITESLFKKPILNTEKFIGTLFNTYFLFDGGEELILIDQHAAHERIRYEALKNKIFKEDIKVPTQRLLLPEVIHFNEEDIKKLSPHLELLEKMGFESEVFGEKQILFREIPEIWGKSNLPQRLKNLLEKLLSEIEENEMGRPSPSKSQKTILLDEPLFEKLASEACHSSVRAGDALSNLGAQNLVDQLFQTEHPWNCPHGRPTVSKVSKTKIEEWFQRKV